MLDIEFPSSLGAPETKQDRWSVHDGQAFAHHVLHEKRPRAPVERRLLTRMHQPGLSSPDRDRAGKHVV